uniref:Uncharacterized protein n=1 Tax=Romanomermis culicivorax TaxID=13658 RepID=A0A915IEP6_ROMCU
MANMIGDHAAEHGHKEVQITPAAQGIIFMKPTWRSRGQKLIRQAQPSPRQPLPQWLKVTEPAKPIFLVKQVSVSISPHYQQWVNSPVFPTTTATIPDVIVQPLSTKSVAA